MTEEENKPIDPKNHNQMKLFKYYDVGVLISILLGTVGFIISIYIIYHNIDATDNELQVMFADETKYIEGRNGDNDTLCLKAKEDYRHYLDTLKFFEGIKIIDSNVHKIKRSYSLNQDVRSIVFDTSSHKFKENYYFKPSKLLYNRLFYSEDSVHLNTVITSLDKFYSKDLNKVSNQKKILLNHYPQLIIWVLLISMAIGFSFYLIPIMIFKINEYNDGLSNLRKGINGFFAILIIIILFIPFVLSNDPHSALLLKPLDVVEIFKIGIKPIGLYYNSMAPFIGPLFWLVLVFMMNSKASSYLDNAEEKNLDSFLNLREDFESFFMMIAIFLGFTIFCTGNFISVLNQLIGVTDKYSLFPSEFSITNGLMQTFFLIVIYLSINSNISFVKEKLIGKFPDKAKTLETLTVKKTVLDKIKLLAAMFAPILGSGFQDLLKLFF